MITNLMLEYNLQEKVEEILSRVLEQDSILQTYLFYGKEGSGKLYYALNFTMSLFCTSKEIKPCGECFNCKSIINSSHPDVRIVNPKKFEKKYIVDSEPTIIKDPLMYHRYDTGDSIAVDSIREIKEYLSVSSFNNGYRVVIINNFDGMTAEASNAFLKILEEPSENVLIILIANKKRAILDTILSRIQLKLFFGAIHSDMLSKLLDEKFDIKLTEKFNGSYLDTIDNYETQNKPMDMIVREIVDFVFGDHKRDEHYSQNKISMIVEKISPIEKYYDKSLKNNVSYVLTKFYDIYHKKVILNEKWNNKIYQYNSEKMNSYAKIEIILAVEKAQKMLTSNVNSSMVTYRFLLRVAKILNNKIFDEELI